MRRRIRILERVRQPTFGVQLEASARRIAAGSDETGDASLVSRGIASKVAAALEQIDRLRLTHERIRRSMLRQELYIDTEILQREPREPVYLDPRLPERDMLRGRLMTLEAERRRLAATEDKELRSLQDRPVEHVIQWRTLGHR